jgi:hypothetical protein
MRFNKKKVKEREKEIKEQKKKILETYKNFNDDNTSIVGKISMK